MLIHSTRWNDCWWRLLFTWAFAFCPSDASSTNVLCRGFEFNVDEPEEVSKKNEKLESAAASNHALLRAFGIEPTKSGIRSYLSSLVPSESASSQVLSLLSQLGDRSFEVRELATEKLMLLPSIKKGMLKDYSDDPETTFRLKLVAEFRATGIQKLQSTLFKTVIADSIQGLVADILNAYDHLENPRTQELAGRAILKIATANDLDILERACTESMDQNELLAIACLNGIDRIDPSRSVAVVASINLTHQKDIFKLACAHLLARNGMKECLELYVDLLESQDRLCRSRAFGQLQSMTRQKFQYSVTATDTQLTASVEQWRTYIGENLNDIPIEFSKRSRLGRMLVCSYNTGKIHSYDEDGKLKWKKTGSNPFACQGLANGNCLVMLYSKGTLLEYDESGQLVKELKGLPKSTSSIQRLSNGNTILAAGQNGNKIVEIDSKGKQVWSAVVKGSPTGAQLQENGLLLVALYAEEKVVEIDRSGDVISEFKVKGQPYTANRLPNGNVLVAFARGGVGEFSEDGTEVWKAVTAANTYWADQLEDNTVVTADTSGILKIAPEGEITSRQTEFKEYTYISSY